MPQTLRIHSNDNVAVALADLPAGAPVDGIVTRAPVPRGHKVSLRPIAAGELVLKYGYPIGRASRDIAAGEHVHSQNVTSHLGADFSGVTFSPRPAGAMSRSPARKTSEGFRRRDGRVG